MINRAAPHFFTIRCVDLISRRLEGTGLAAVMVVATARVTLELSAARWLIGRVVETGELVGVGCIVTSVDVVGWFGVGGGRVHAVKDLCGR